MAEKIRLTKEGTQDRFVTESQLQPFLDQGFTQVTADTPISAPVAPTDPAQKAAFEFAQKPITSEAMEEESAIDLSETVDDIAVDDTSGADAAADQAAEDAKKFVEDQQKLREDTRTEAQQRDVDLGKELADLAGDVSGKAAFTTAKEQELETPIEAELNKVTSRMNILRAEKEQFRISQEGKPITMQSITGSIAQNNAKLNGEILMLSAVASGLRGDLALAEKQVEQAVNAKYGPIEEEIAIKKAQRAAIADIVDDDEKAQLDALDAAAEADKQELEDKKQEEKDIQKVMLSAIEAGITDQNTLDRISNASTVVEAARLAQISLPEAPVSPSQEPSPTEKPMSTNQIEQFRRSYGWTPPFGFTNDQLIQYMNDNPDATPEELEAGARQAGGEPTDSGVAEEQFLSADYLRDNFSQEELKAMSNNFGTSKWYTGAIKDVNRFLEQVQTKIDEARQAGHSDNEILEFLKP